MRDPFLFLISTFEPNLSLDLYPEKQCFGSGSGRILLIWSDPDPDPYQEALIWIRVAPKDYYLYSL